MIENSNVSITLDISKRIFLIIFILNVAFSCFGSSSVRTALPAERDAKSSLLPVDSKIGIICEADSSEYHLFLSSLLSKEYSYEWGEKYIAPSSRSALVALFGQWLEEHLPLDGYLTSVLLENGDNSVSINVRKGDDSVCFVIERVEDRFYIVAMKLL